MSPAFSGDVRAEKLLSVRDVASRLRVSTFTVYRLCWRGELAHVRISNAIRISPEALDAYLAGPS